MVKRQSKQVKNGVKYYIVKGLKVIKKIFLGFIVLSFFLTILYRFINPPFTPLMLIRCVEQIFNDKTLRLKKQWVDIENISPKLIRCVIISEDQKFLEHNGFDFESIAKVYDMNKKNKNIKGASTISQQTAKNVFLWPSRSWIRKGLEAYFTILIELCWSKKRIMEVYLNVIEMGDGIYGAEATSNFYFNKKSKDLKLSEAALIAACLPAPLKWHPNKPYYFILQKQNWIMQRYWKYKDIKL